MTQQYQSSGTLIVIDNTTGRVTETIRLGGFKITISEKIKQEYKIPQATAATAIAFGPIAQASVVHIRATSEATGLPQFITAVVDSITFEPTAELLLVTDSEPTISAITFATQASKGTTVVEVFLAE